MTDGPVVCDRCGRETGKGDAYRAETFGGLETVICEDCYDAVHAAEGKWE